MKDLRRKCECYKKRYSAKIEFYDLLRPQKYMKSHAWHYAKKKCWASLTYTHSKKKLEAQSIIEMGKSKVRFGHKDNVI